MAISQDTLAILRKVRTSDVTDALDSLGMMNSYEMDPRIRPLFPGIRFAGIATTAAFNLIDVTIPRMSYDEFDDRQYKRNPDGSTHSDALWPAGHKFGAPDEVHVIDCKQSRCGLLGSNNVLDAAVKGTVGLIIDGACRDSDECILQKSPVFCSVRSMRHMAGRLELASTNQPITCGGVMVRPGDGIVADGDGVIVIPQAEADDVAKRAWKVQDKDRRMRRAFYEKLGMPMDETVALEERPW
ncbi:RraA family protein [Rhodobacteraceae bacterium 2CG4]|uniref:Putative 4-hydroxy-4-methyl-2-oxoglutarate aldolase n=1 Tax=Halovulum marinum TaxID=2662447 RepID=A0A6L5YZQ9_9RHOB|nr:RraA family protein [Halovulum marinum]MSU89345.1 RraA family protein [Halovulum marinum]